MHCFGLCWRLLAEKERRDDGRKTHKYDCATRQGNDMQPPAVGPAARLVRKNMEQGSGVDQSPFDSSLFPVRYCAPCLRIWSAK